MAVVGVVKFSVRVNNDLSLAELTALAVAAEARRVRPAVGLQ